MLDKGVKKFIIIGINIVHAEMRKKATPLSQRESRLLKDFYKKAAWADSEHLRQTATYRLR